MTAGNLLHPNQIPIQEIIKIITYSLIIFKILPFSSHFACRFQNQMSAWRGANDGRCAWRMGPIAAATRAGSRYRSANGTRRRSARSRAGNHARARGSRRQGRRKRMGNGGSRTAGNS